MTDSFDLRLEKIRRRAANRFAVELGAVGMVTAILVGSVVVSITRPAQPASVFLTAGIAAAAVVSAVIIRRRVSPASVATDLDRRLRLDELLGTAARLDDRIDPWSRAVVALAAAELSRLHPAVARPAHLGRWSWTLLAALAALGPALLLLHPPNPPVPPPPDISLSSAIPPPDVAATTLSGLTRRPDADPESADASRPQAPPPTAAVAHASDATDVTDADPSRSRPGDGGTGPGSASDDRKPLVPRPPLTTGTDAAKPGTVASAGGSETSTAPPGPLTTGTAAGGAPVINTPAATLADWNRARDTAARAVADDAVPPESRALVRAYFDLNQKR